MRIPPLAALLATVIALAGCNGGSNPPSNPPTVSQIAGEYTGTATDSVFGSGSAAVTLSQTASSIGGTLIETFGATTITNALAITIDLDGNVAGSATATVPSNANTCGFKVTGTYANSTGNLNGNYSAYSGCSGETGSFTMTQQCTDPSIPGAVHRRRPDSGHGILPC